MADTIYCAGCNAPNPARSAHCYACKQPLSSSGVETPPLLPDLAGGVASAVAAASSELLTRAEKPPGWDVEVLPDGMVGLTRTRRTQAYQMAFAAPGFLLILAFSLLGGGRGAHRYHTYLPGYPFTALTLAGLVTAAVITFLCSMKAKETWRVGPNLLETGDGRVFTHHPVLRIEKLAQNYGAGRALGIGAYATGGGHATYRLCVDSVAGRQVLTTGYSLLAPLGLDLSSRNDVYLLASFLSAHTGWSVQDGSPTGHWT